MSTFSPVFHTIKTATFNRVVTNAHGLNLNLHDQCVIGTMLSGKINMFWMRKCSYFTKILPLICKSITQVRGNEFAPLEDNRSLMHDLTDDQSSAISSSISFQMNK